MMQTHTYNIISTVSYYYFSCMHDLCRTRLIWLAPIIMVHLLCTPGINECEVGADNCAADSTCTDTLGNFECTCNPGFSGDGIVACISEFS